MHRVGGGLVGPIARCIHGQVAMKPQTARRRRKVCDAATCELHEQDQKRHVGARAWRRGGSTKPKPEHGKAAGRACSARNRAPHVQRQSAGRDASASALSGRCRDCVALADVPAAQLSPAR